MTVIVFVGWMVSVNVLLYFWYRRARRKRRVEMTGRRLDIEIRRAFDLSPRDAAELREMVEEAHRSPRV